MNQYDEVWLREIVANALRDAQKNAEYLNDCKVPHDFKIINQDTKDMKYKCIKCGGVVSRTVGVWYIRGMEHALKGMKDEG